MHLAQSGGTTHVDLLFISYRTARIREVVLSMLDNPIAWAALICFLLGLVLCGLVRLTHTAALGSLVPPAVFLASYVQTYQQVPPFPPVGATNKIFYIAVSGTLVGFVLDLLPPSAMLDRLLAVIVPAMIVGWIGWPRFANADLEIVATTIALWLGGLAVLWRMAAVTKATAERNGGSLVGISMLMALMLGFAPVALLGGSSTSLMLCFAAFAGLGAVAIWELVVPREAFRASAILGVGSGFLAVVDTVTLITRQIDFAALALLLVIPYAGDVGARFLLPHRIRGRTRQVLIGFMTASPVLVVTAILLLRHPESFMS